MRTCDNDPVADVILMVIELSKMLSEFDHYWITYEQLYVSELIMIETNARRHIVLAIETEDELSQIEENEKCKSKIVINSSEFHKARAKLIEILAHINSVANIEGKGRDDFTEQILSESESIMRKISSSCSKAIRKLAEDVKKSFSNLRELMRKYKENLDMVDPQLRNNPDLTECLSYFEKSWEKAKDFIVNPLGRRQLIHLSQIIEIVAEKHKDIREKIESVDSEVFLIIPCIVVLDSFDNNDENICEKYFPNMKNDNSPENTQYKKAKNKYLKIQEIVKDEYAVYNLFEELIVQGKNMGNEHREGMWKKVEKDEVNSIIHNIKLLAIGMQRNNPTSWNSFIQTSLV